MGSPVMAGAPGQNADGVKVRLSMFGRSPMITDRHRATAASNAACWPMVGWLPGYRTSMSNSLIGTSAGVTVKSTGGSAVNVPRTT